MLWCIKALTVIVSFDCANKAEELNHPTEVFLHLKHKHARQDLKCKHAQAEIHNLVFSRSNRSFNTHVWTFHFNLHNNGIP